MTSTPRPHTPLNSASESSSVSSRRWARRAAAAPRAAAPIGARGSRRGRHSTSMSRLSRIWLLLPPVGLAEQVDDVDAHLDQLLRHLLRREARVYLSGDAFEPQPPGPRRRRVSRRGALVQNLARRLRYPR